MLFVSSRRTNFRLTPLFLLDWMKTCGWGLCLNWECTHRYILCTGVRCTHSVQMRKYVGFWIYLDWMQQIAFRKNILRKSCALFYHNAYFFKSIYLGVFYSSNVSVLQQKSIFTKQPGTFVVMDRSIEDLFKGMFVQTKCGLNHQAATHLVNHIS